MKLPIAILATLVAVPALATEPGWPDALRVCADPNAMPYSDDRLEGFENRLAALVGADLGIPVSYVWHADRRGFLRQTLLAGGCDVVMEIPSNDDAVAATRPYFRSGYVFLTRNDEAPIASLDDPALRTLRIGVPLIGDDGANSPAAEALARRGIIDNVVGSMVYGNAAAADPQKAMVDAVADGDVDVAILWGPIAGYYARNDAGLTFTAVTPDFDPPGIFFQFAMSMGVRLKDTDLRIALNGFIIDHQAEIDALLAEFGFPQF